MNSSPTILRLRSGSSTPASRDEESLLRLHVHERHVEVPAERLDDLVRLAPAQQPVVDEDARQLVADGLVHEQRRHRRVDAAAQRAEHALASDLRADPLDLLLDHRRRRPRGRRVRDVVEEVLQHLHPVRRVHDLGVELHAVDARLGLLERGDRRRRRTGDDARTARRRDDRVAMRHPHRLLAGQVVEELRLLDAQLRLAELRDARAVDAAAEIEREQLHAVTDAERRHAEVEERRIDTRRAVRIHGRRPAAEDQRVRVPRAHLLRRDRVRHELREDAALAHAPRDQLRVLPAEIDDEHRPLLRARLREGQDLGLSADSSAPPS